MDQASITPVTEFGLDRYIDRELSWLAFNQRVLELGEAAEVPLLERTNFLAIFPSNLDEWFMVRVAGLKRRIDTGLDQPTPAGVPAREILRQIRSKARDLQLRHARVFSNEVRPALANEGIHILGWDELDGSQQERLTDIFSTQIFPVLMPLAVDPAHPFPYISGLSLNFSVRVKNPLSGKIEFARLKVPPVLPRLYELDAPDGETWYILLEDLIAQHLDSLFPGMEVVDHHAFRVTRNEDMLIEEDETENLLQALEKELLRRRFGPPIRLEASDDMDDETLEILKAELDITNDEVTILPGPLDLSALFALGKVNRPDLKYTPQIPVTVAEFRTSDSDEEPDIFRAIAERDVLVHHPYESFSTSVQAFIEQAANDPDVLAIKQTLYRTSGDSPIIASLIKAAESGKQVLALVEIKARFDEQNNIVWARKLEKAGVHVVYGLVGLKTHCKLLQVIRKEEGHLHIYNHIGTGNYNPKTSRIYEDLGLFTDDEEVSGDITRLFNQLSGYAIERDFKRLLVAPLHLRPGLLQLIRNERDAALRGEPSRIRIKVNSMVDEELTDALYEASQAGVPVDIWVRGICSVRPGVPGLSENIRVRSVVGRNLEHSRLFSFHNGGDTQIYIGSADMMHRNLDRRIEALVRLTDPDHLRTVTELFDLGMSDDSATWHLNSDETWTRHHVSDQGEPLTDVHNEVMRRTAARPRRYTLR
ncbi:RNA degradosome polyphosphate kinase [Gulosibacter molinativorax]|uniref:Polyphosphate kinase n=1 Tax=Gulosibacter molinativorax TaxID=256821 RepID=A0ABT7C425_9MICO|nr:RNA degradosome polyphosphate kinase [Gulosibacter molinativorax]MDJ1369965.1 RNA degradosome polyphosphate kinase [Gulosibacter molinativorax]QUY63845.1 Polyphosphate kinase [Gulosibacter molinativorax]